MNFSKEQIKEISEQLDCGFKAFYHKKNGELIFVPDSSKHIHMDTDAWQDELDQLEENYSDYREIKAMESNDSFRMMTHFVEQLTDTQLKNQLINALNSKKPFRSFKFVIDNAGAERKKWFEFKNQYYIDWTLEQLEIHRHIYTD